tara:strand:+ start:46 stop:279 length:234 start_codon:yes stop_codon:yes gene_type:complete
MIEDSSNLVKGQILKVDLSLVQDRLPSKLIIQLKKDPIGTLVGWKMVDGNSFGLVLRFNDGSVNWFFEEELSLVESF